MLVLFLCFLHVGVEVLVCVCVVGYTDVDSCMCWRPSEHPDMLGALNPHNSEITMLFGDQGGY